MRRRALQLAAGAAAPGVRVGRQPQELGGDDEQCHHMRHTMGALESTWSRRGATGPLDLQKAAPGMGQATARDLCARPASQGLEQAL